MALGVSSAKRPATASTAVAIIPFDRVPPRFDAADDRPREDAVRLAELREVAPELFEDEADFPAVDRDFDVEDLPPAFDAGFAERDDVVPLPADDVFVFIDPLDPDLEVPDDLVPAVFFADELFDDLEVDREEVDFAVEDDLVLAPDDLVFDPPDFDAEDFDEPDLEVEDFLVVAMMFLRVIELSLKTYAEHFCKRCASNQRGAFV